MASLPVRLWSTSDIARRLGVSRERARQLIASADFPAHEHETGRTRLWNPDLVERWIAEHRPGDAKDAVGV